MRTDPSVLAWREPGTQVWFVHQRRSRRWFKVHAADRAHLERQLGGLPRGQLGAEPWPVIASQVPACESLAAVARVEGAGALAGALRALVRPRRSGPVMVVQARFAPTALQELVAAGERVLPVFFHEEMLVVGPLLAADRCPCVRCLVGRLIGSAPQPRAALVLAEGRPGEGDVFGVAPDAALDPEGLQRLTAQVADAALGVLCDEAARGRVVYTVDLSTGAWSRRIISPLPGAAGDHAWKLEAIAC